MRNSISKARAAARCPIFLITTPAAATPQVASVAGTWTVHVSGDAGTADQTIVLQQAGNKIAGKFKGPRQSGEIEGTLTGNAIQFHVKAHVELDYTGTVGNDAMKGTVTGKGKTGNWTAVRARSNPRLA